MKEPDKAGLWEFRHPESPGWLYRYEVTEGGSWHWQHTQRPEDSAYCPPPRGFQGGEWRWLNAIG